MSSRNILCEKCARDHLPAGTRQIYAANDLEPAEYQRLTVGRAAQPSAEQRYIAVNGVRTALDPSCYNCDTCNAEIKPGEKCAAWTIWVDHEKIPEFWETEFLTAEAVDARI